MNVFKKIGEFVMKGLQWLNDGELETALGMWVVFIVSIVLICWVF